ncbi:hypothetical protein ABT314_29665 [Streptomyces spiralis]
MTVVQQHVPQEPVPWPHQVGVIPHGGFDALGLCLSPQERPPEGL